MKKFLILNVFLTFLLIVWGGVVRNMGAGLACPDWPLCHGRIIPPFDLPVLIEWGHRLLASIVGCLTLGICVAALLSQKYKKIIGGCSLLALFLVVGQAILGGMTVKGLLNPHWVSSHLAVGLLFFMTLLWMVLRCERVSEKGSVGLSVLASTFFSKLSDNHNMKQKMFFLMGGVTILVYGQVLLGGWVSSSGAGLSCPDFPTCHGEWIPPLVGLVKFQFFHRWVGLLVFLVIGGMWMISKYFHIGPQCERAMLTAFVMTLIQVLLGIGNVLFQLPTFLSIAHLMMATLLVAFLFVSAYRIKHAQLS